MSGKQEEVCDTTNQLGKEACCAPDARRLRNWSMSLIAEVRRGMRAWTVERGTDGKVGGW